MMVASASEMVSIRTPSNYLLAKGDRDGAQSTAPDVTVADPHDW